MIARPPVSVPASMTYSAFFALLELWDATLQHRLAVVEAPVHVRQFIRGANSYSAELPPLEEGHTRWFEEDAEQWAEEWSAPWFTVNKQAAEEQHRLLQARGLLRSIRESMDAQHAHFMEQRSPENEPYWSNACVWLGAVREVREAVGALGVDPVSSSTLALPSSVWL